MSRDLYFLHGHRHSPDGADPSLPGYRHLIGATDEPAFENGWANMAATIDIPTPVPMHFSIVVGRANWVDLDGTTILQYRPKVLEIAGDIDTGTDGTTVFTLPPEFRYEHDRPMDGHDIDMNPVACRLYSDGRFVRGQP